MVFAVLGRVRLLATRGRNTLAAPQRIEDVDREDPRVMFRWVRAQEAARGHPWRPDYAWGLLTAGVLANALGIRSISALEFGVAGGNGLVAMERAARQAESLLGVRIDVYGFDTGTGMPAPVDHRDAPFSVLEGHFPMDVEKLQSRLDRAQLRLGLVADTVPAFLQEEHAPVGFISNEIDFYSASRDSLGLLDAPAEKLLPRIPLYCQSTMWHPWTDFLGMRLAIRDFNEAHEQRKLSPIHGLKYSLPASEREDWWPEKFWIAEIFDHPEYATPQGSSPLETRLMD